MYTNILVGILKGRKHFKVQKHRTVEGKGTIIFNIQFWSFEEV
jgi:hypothetical protein